MFTRQISKPQAEAAAATPQRLPPRTSGLAGNGRRPAQPDSAGELAGTAPRHVWDFGKIAVSPPERTNLHRAALRSDVRALPGPLQAKLLVGSVDDPLEREADQVAERVMQAPPGRMPDISPVTPHVERKCQECGQEDEVRRKASPGGAVGRQTAPAALEHALASPGRPLDQPARDFVGPRLGRSLGQVRVHEGPLATAAALAVGARAFTVGRDIVFGAGEYAPSTASGRKLLAHELAHVVQQTGANRLPVGAAGIDVTTSPRMVRRLATTDCDSKAGLVTNAVSQAQSNIAAVLPQLAARPLSADTQNALLIYFRASSDETAATVSANLTKISAKLGAVTYECENDCPENELGYTRLGTMLTGLGSIHLCLNNLEQEANAIANTALHEVTHYTLLATDAAGYYGSDCSESETTVGAGSQTKLSTADSYNCFVENGRTGTAARRAETKGDLTGANIAGIEQTPAGPINLSASRRKLLFAMKLTRGPLAIIPGVSYRWVLRDPQNRGYRLTDTDGNDLFEFKPAAESVLAAINEPTRELLKQRGISRAIVVCRATSPVFGDKVFELPVTLSPSTPEVNVEDLPKARIPEVNVEELPKAPIPEVNVEDLPAAPTPR
jgi:hypothetical protein